MAIHSIPADTIIFGKQGGVAPVQPSFFNFLALGMAADAALSLMAAQPGTPLFFR
jgi:hypothetical protein